MKFLAVVLGLGLLLISEPNRAQAGKIEDCRAAIVQKRVCAGTAPNNSARTACVKAAIARCKQGGPGAL